MKIMTTKQTFKRARSVLLCGLAIVLAAHADPATREGETYAMTFTSADGSTATFLFSDSPRQTFTANATVITTAATTVELPNTMKHVQTFSVQQNPAGISATTVGNSTWTIRPSAVDIVTTPKSTVNLYSTEGKLLNSVRCDESGRATLNTSLLNKGVYIVKLHQTTFKFHKQ